MKRLILAIIITVLLGCDSIMDAPASGGGGGGVVTEDTARVAAAIHALETAQSYGWRLESVSQFARVGVWYRQDPFWTVGLPIVQPDPETPDSVECVVIKNIQHCVQPVSNISYSFIDGEGANQSRAYWIGLFGVRSGDLYFAKYHHETNVLTVMPVYLKKVPV